jgi:hypothetical protein
MPVSYAAWSMSEISQEPEINKKLKKQGVAAGGIAVMIMYYAIYALRQDNSQSLLNLWWWVKSVIRHECLVQIRLY